MAGKEVSKAAAPISSVTWGPPVHKSVLHNLPSDISHTKGKPWKGSIQTAQIDATNPSTGGYGFEFHYNPQQIQVDTQQDSGVNPNMMQNYQTAATLWVHQQQIQFTLRLNRIADMTETNLKNFVGHVGMDSTSLNFIKKFGTLYDLEFIYRTVNSGIFVNDFGYESSDVGYLMTNVIKVQFSKYWAIYGFLTDVQVNHLQFSIDMVPTLTDVTLSLQRQSSATSHPVDAKPPKDASTDNSGKPPVIDNGGSKKGHWQITPGGQTVWVLD